MKRLLKKIIVSIAALYTVTLINKGFTYTNGYPTLLIGGFVMVLLDILVEPILNLIFLPINFMTAGLFKWVVGAIILYALTIVVSGIQVSAWTFEGYQLHLPHLHTIVIPEFTFSYWMNLILVSILFNVCAAIYIWILTD